jgi:hypothetical protein
MRLVRVELDRLRWRRAVVVLVVLGALLMLLVLGARLWETRPVSDGDRAAAQGLVEEQQRFIEQDIARCERNPRRYGAALPGGSDRCRQVVGSYQPSVDDFLYREQLDAADERENGGLVVVAALAILLFVVGTTYAGHDWNTGSMSNQLLFEPRRLRLFAAKAVALALLAVALAVLVLAVFWAVVLAVAASSGVDPDGQTVVDVLQHAGRGTVMVVVAALGGYGLTMLTRSTVFTVATLAVVAVAGGLLFGLVADGDLRYEPATNALALVNGRAEFYRQVPPECYELPRRPAGLTLDDCRETVEVRQGAAALYYGVGLSLLGAASAASYRRRDVP